MARKVKRPKADVHNYQHGSTKDDPSCTIKVREKGNGKATVVNTRGKTPDLATCVRASNKIIKGYIPDEERDSKAKKARKAKKK